KRPVLRQLSTDNPVVLPVGKKVLVLVTATDVLHNWAISPLAVRIDTVPGRLNETWVEIKKPGTYFGFCSELCGSGHAFMPIEVHAVTESEFKQWVKKAQKIYAKVDNITTPIAARNKDTTNSINLAGGTAPQ
ncbi:MAG: cytochrome C oxidase subunit II, partial [Rhodospirillaceae bacterium]|nr:cytochrome C oxidase subunit II [Rhodospirillaceae bacterium]